MNAVTPRLGLVKISRRLGVSVLVLVLVLVLGVVLGCVSVERLAPVVDPVMTAAAAEAGHSAESLHRGRAVYLSRCVSCHSLEPIERYTVAQWQDILPDMAQEARLNPQQTKDLRHYVLMAHRLLAPSDADKAPQLSG